MLPDNPSAGEMIIITTPMPRLRSLPGGRQSPWAASRGMDKNSLGLCLRNSTTPTPDGLCWLCLLPPEMGHTELAQPLQEFSWSCGDTWLLRLEEVHDSSCGRDFEQIWQTPEGLPVLTPRTALGKAVALVPDSGSVTWFHSNRHLQDLGVCVCVVTDMCVNSKQF